MTDSRPREGRTYPLGPTTRQDSLPPSYERVVARFSDRELREEIDSGLGDEGYQQALAAEVERRQRL